MKTKDTLTIEDKYNLLTGRVPMLLNRLLSTNFKQHGVELSREQWSILAVLWKEDGVSQQALADVTLRDKPSTTRLIDNLEKEQYLFRKAHESDRRQNLIFLTTKGRDVEQKVMEVLEITMDQAITGVTVEETEVIRDVFERIHQNIKNSI